MMLGSLLNPNLVAMDLAAGDAAAAIRALADAVERERNVSAAAVIQDVAARERKGSTLIPTADGCTVAIPHALTSAARQLTMAVGLSPPGVPWQATAAGGGRANAIFLLLAPPQCQSLYLRVLGRIGRLCETRGFLSRLVGAATPQAVIDLFSEAEKELGEIVAAEGMPKFCVVGAGHGGLAMAAHLSMTGCSVNLFNRSPERIYAVDARGGIDVGGEIEGFAALNRVTTDPAAAIDDVEIIMVVVPASAHRNVAEMIAPHLKDGQIVVLNPGRTGGALEVARIFRERNPSVRPYIAEAQTLLYASRVTNPGQVRIFGIKNSVPLATLPSWQVVDVLPAIRKVLPQFVPGDNVLKTSLDNIGAVFHPAITILNAARIEDTHGDFQYYVEGVTPAVAAVLEDIDRERVAVATALGIRANTAREWLYLAYDAAGRTLLDAIRANPGYVGIQAPGTVQHRYISEDVPYSLVPLASIGRMFDVPTPTIEAIIRLAGAMHGVDYWAEGRTVDRLGIKGMTKRDLRFLVIGAEPAPPQVESPAEGSV